MNAVEIEEAVSQLAAEPFDRAEFAFAFLRAFDNKETTIRRLRGGSASDVRGGMLQRNNLHLAVCGEGAVAETLAALRASPKSTANRVKFVLATDGVEVQAHDLAADEPLACPLNELGKNFGFFLPLAGISTVRQIKDNPIDVKATGRLNKLYVELLKDNPDWSTEARRPELNRFMARLIFCFFAEDTGIFLGEGLFSRTVEQMSDKDAGNTHAVLAEMFRAMATPTQHEGGPDVRYRAAADIRPWADAFPYVNGGLFEEAGEVPRFSRMARTYLLRAAELSWREINPDIFGSMIQAVADDDERGSLGLHYTSVPNILKVLNPLFLDSLREQLDAAGDSPRKLRTLRRRLAAIRVFDPACGSGNFLVIAYIRMREIEHEIVARTGDEPKSVIALTNFYGIEIKGFAAEIARLALLIAEFQCDARLISQQAARSMVLPLHRTGQIHIGNALRMDWLAVCPPAPKVAAIEHDLGGPTGRLALEENGLFTATAIETYICGNPPYKGNADQTTSQKSDIRICLEQDFRNWRSLDYICGWFFKSHQHSGASGSKFGLVSTNSIAQGQSVTDFWYILRNLGAQHTFAVLSFKWRNLAKSNAGVTVVVIGGARISFPDKIIYEGDHRRAAANINGYLLDAPDVWVERRSSPVSLVSEMVKGNYYGLSEPLLIAEAERRRLIESGVPAYNIRRFKGGAELVDGDSRYCLWFPDEKVDASVLQIAPIKARFDSVRKDRLASPDKMAKAMASRPHQFREMHAAQFQSIVIPVVSSEKREYLSVTLEKSGTVFPNTVFALYDVPLWNLALIASRIHLVWIATVCGKLETRYRYSNPLGWNTFPVPPLTELQKADLTRCVEDILLVREAHYPATIADLYDPETMPDDLRAAHERNDEVLERIYIGRRFRNDTERLEKLFNLYTKMIAAQPSASKPARKGARASRTAQA